MTVACGAFAPFAPASDFLDQNFRQDMGSPKFDSNKVTKFQVNETNGNLFLKYHLMTFPNHRGMPLNVYLTYNSRNFDSPHLFGMGCWSFSLSKYLKFDTYYRIDDPGPWEDVGEGLEEGDFVDSLPDGEHPLADEIAQINEVLPGLYGDSGELGWEIGILETLREDVWGDISDYDSWIAIADGENSGYQGEIDDWNGIVDLLGPLEEEWEGLYELPNWERDGNPYWLIEELWQDFQLLGGNDGFLYAGELADALEEIGILAGWITDNDEDIILWTEERDRLEYDVIPGYDSDIETMGGELEEINGLIEELEIALAELEPDEDWELDEADYDEVDGTMFVDGEGEGFFIYQDYYWPEDNYLHVNIDDQSRQLTFKDGRVYSFESAGGGRIVSMRDRYGNDTTFSYQTNAPGHYLSEVVDSSGHSVKLFYESAWSIGGSFLRVYKVTISAGGEDRDFTFGYDAQNHNLTSITNPEGETYHYEYIPREDVLGPEWPYSRRIQASQHLVHQVLDPRGNSVNFEYADGRNCTRIWKEDQYGVKTRDTDYKYNGFEIEITDSRGNTVIKSKKRFGSDEVGEPPERWMIDGITDPYSKLTTYEYDSSAFNLIKTIDTNGLTHLMEYDDMGNLLRKIADPNGYYYVTEYTYEEVYNQVTSVTDANDHTYYYHYVAGGLPSGYGTNGVLWKEVDGRGEETLHWYNDFGQRIKTEDPRGNITEYEYDDAYYYLSKLTKYINYPGQYYEKTFAYDGFGNKTSETDFNGNLVEFNYDEMNRLVTEEVHEGEEVLVTAYYYDVVGNRTDMVNPRGYVTKYEYDGFDRLTIVTEAYGETEARIARYVYDTEDNKKYEIDPNGNLTTFEPDALNRLTRKIEPLGKITVYEYLGDGDSSTNGGTHKYDRSKDRYTSMRQRNVDYDGNFEWLKTRYEYDELYRLIKVTDPEYKETDYGYDPVGNKVWEEDANDERTYFDYDEDNRVEKITDPFSNYVEYAYDPAGNKERERDKRGHWTAFSYDELNRMTRTVDAEGGELLVLYDGMNKTAERDRNGNWTAFSHNDRNLLVAVHYPIVGIHSYIDYDEVGNKVEETDPNGNVTRYDYNGLNRLTRKTDGYGVLDLETNYAYDDNGNRTAITDAEENTTEYKYDALNRLTEVWDPINGSGKPTKYTYDLLGNKLSTTDSKKNLTTYQYDRNSRLVKKIDAKRREISFEYDDVGNRRQQLDPENRTIRYEYDALNRLTRRGFKEISEWVTYSYDATGNRIVMVDSTGTTTYAYDDVNRLLSVTTPGPAGSRTVGYTYYPNGERETMTDPDSGVTEYEYDDMNRLIYLTDPDDGVTGYVFDAGSRLVEMVYPSGAVASYDQYDAANRLIHLKTTDSDATATFTEFTYVYDDVGNRTAMSDLSGTTAYAYDDLYRLTSVTYPDTTACTYYYDAVGNREKEINNGVAKDYVYNNLNQLVTWSSGGTGTATRLITITGIATDADLVSVFVNQTEASLNNQTYTAEVLFTVGTNVVTATATDAAGNTASSQIECHYRPSLATLVEYEYDKNGCLVGKAVDGTYYTVYEYDYENRLTRVTLPDASTNEFVYDGDKRRVSRKDASGEEKWFLYDGINILQDLATDGTVWTSYVQGIGIDKLISVSEWCGQTSPQKRYYHSDAIGSVRSLTDDDETEVGTYTYDAWGKVTSETGSSENEYKFTSRRWEQDLGLQYNRARFYDPEVGRFITPDPLTGGPDDPTISYFSGVYSQFHRFIKEHISALNPDKHNRYVYCYNNPVNLVDPLGLEGTNAEIGDAQPDPQPVPTPATQQTPPPEASSTPDTTQVGKTADDVVTDHGVKKASDQIQTEDVAIGESFESQIEYDQNISKENEEKELTLWEKIKSGHYVHTQDGLWAAEWWAKNNVQPDNKWYEDVGYFTGGCLASLWTPETWWKTSAVIIGSGVVDHWVVTGQIDKVRALTELIMRMYTGELPPSDFQSPPSQPPPIESYNP